MQLKEKLAIVYPGGGGGKWLSHLIFCLENNQTQIESVTPFNFHKHKHSNNVIVTHWQHALSPDVSDIPTIVFSSKYKFNFYLNSFLKELVNRSTWENYTITDQFNELSQQSSYKFTKEWCNDYEDRIDLHYDLIFTDAELFLNQLFIILDQVGITYDKNYEFALASIENYKNSCPNVNIYYDNFDSIYWLGWCSGVLHAEKIPAGIDYNHIELDKVAESFLSRRQLFKDYSIPFILTSN
jgi:hypothetical protein